MTAHGLHRASTSQPFSWRIRADLFAQLAAMEKAGLPVIQALGLIRLSAASQSRVAMTCKLMAAGTEISVAGRRSGLFTELEANLIGAAASAGSPALTYRRLADHYAQRAMQARALKSRLTLPGLVLIVGLLTQPLPALLSGALSIGGYLLHCFAPLVAIAALACLALNVSRLQEGPSSPVRASIDKILMGMPLFGAMLIRRSIRDFFESLALMLEAGMPILQALPKALDTVQLSAVHNAFAPIRSKIARGSTLTQALADIRYLGNGQALALINTGEGSGTLPEMLFRYAAMETSAINDFHKQVADWLPRIIYAAVAGWVAYGILSGASIGPNLPPELR